MQTVAFISGATGFAGSLLADHLANQGVGLVLSSKDEIALSAQISRIKDCYPSIFLDSIICDLADPNSWYSTAHNLKKFKINSYINCSGIQGQLGPISSISHEEIERVFNINLFSSIYFSNFFAKEIRDNQRLSIIHFSGGGAAGPRPYFMPYSLSKTALVRFVENFAAENSKKNIQINAVAPGVLPSKMQIQILDSLNAFECVDNLIAAKSLAEEHFDKTRLLNLIDFIRSDKSFPITGKLISAEWDKWSEWTDHADELIETDLYTLRRVTARARGKNWGDL
jgi:3-oxoacyl-[acyl-carrier protein] reductase